MARQLAAFIYLGSKEQERSSTVEWADGYPRYAAQIKTKVDDLGSGGFAPQTELWVAL